MQQLIYRVIYQPVINRLLRFFNKLLVSVLPESLRLPPSGIIEVKLKTGRFRFSTNQTNTTSQLLYWKGPYDIEYTVIFEELIKKCSTFFDVGAHAGYYSLVAAAVNDKIQVVAFEPAAGPYHYLRENIAINGFADRITARQLALGEQEGTAAFLEVVHAKYTYLKHNLVAVGNLANYQPNRNMKKTEVEVTTLDRFIATSGITPDIIKMDTEGTEHHILRGAARTLGSRPIVIAETLFNTIEKELEAIMRSHKYSFFNYHGGVLQEVKTIARTADNGVHDCFFVPPEKRALVVPFLKV